MEVLTASNQEEVTVCIASNGDEEVADNGVEVKEETYQYQSPDVDMEMEVDESCKTGKDDDEDEVKIEFSEEEKRTDDDADPLVDYNHEAILPHDEDSDNDSQSETSVPQKKQKTGQGPGPWRSRNYYIWKECGQRLKKLNEERRMQRLKDIAEGVEVAVKKPVRKYVSPPPKHRSSTRIKLKGKQGIAETFQTRPDRPSKTNNKLEKKQEQQDRDELTLEIKKLKSTCPLQLLLNPENSMEHHCLICYKKLIEDGNSQKKNMWDDGLHNNLNILVILRSLLQVPSEDVKNCLLYGGNPINWVRICEECEPLIKKALSVNAKLVEVLKQLNKCRELIVEQMKISIRNKKESLKKSGKCPTCGIIRCRGHEKYLTDKIRTFVSKKTYPATTYPYEDGDREAEAKARVASEVILNGIMDMDVVKVPVEDMTEMSYSCSDHEDNDQSSIPEDGNTDDGHVEVQAALVAPLPLNVPLFLVQHILPSSDMLAPIRPEQQLVAPSELVNLPSRDELALIVVADSSLHNSIFNVSTKTYHCSACPALPTPDGMSFNQFLCHITFHIRRPFQCTECRLFFPMNDTVREQHWKLWHEDTVPSGKRFQIVLLRPVNLWGCLFCDEKFSTESDRDGHLTTKHELQHKVISKQYVCFHCPRMFYNKMDRRTHIVVDQCSNANIFNCLICEKGFKRTTAAGMEYVDEPALYQHIDEAHPDQISWLKLKACELCGLVFTGVPKQFPGLVTHKRTTHGYATAFLCHICDENFASESLLNVHVSSIHPKNVPNPPHIASKTVKKARKSTRFPATQTQVKLPSVSRRPIEPTSAVPTPVILTSTSTLANDSAHEHRESTYKISALSKSKPLLYSCALCPYLIPKRLYDFLKHIEFHNKRPNRCLECSVYLPNDEEVISDHWTQFHKGCDKFPRCAQVAVNLENIRIYTKCPESFTSIEDFLHERRSHQSHDAFGDGKYTCVTCSKNLESFLEWQLHRAVEHPQVAEMSCFYCEATFVMRAKEGIDLCDFVRRLEHVKDKHPDEEIKLSDPCHLCGIDFSVVEGSSYHLKKVHSISEAEAKNFQCPIPHCRHASKRHCQFRQHVYGVHIPSNEKYVCDSCGWSGKQIGKLHHHQFKHHRIVPQDTIVVDCEFKGCSFQALNKFHLKKHAVIHLPEKDRPFKCKVCEKGFHDRSHLTEHEEIHKNKESKPYQCEICGNSFAVKNYLYIHKRLSHQRRFFPSTHKKKIKRTPSKGLSKPKKHSQAPTSTTSSEFVQICSSEDILVSPEKCHGLPDEPVVIANVEPTINLLPPTDGSLVSEVDDQSYSYITFSL